jgi:hypothetical protein
MRSPRFVILVFAVLSLCKTRALGQNTVDSEPRKEPTQCTLRDISEHDSPLRVVGKVLFRANPIVLTYEVEATVKNVSEKDVLSWSLLVRTSDGMLHFTSLHDYFFTGDVLVPGGVGTHNFRAYQLGRTSPRRHSHKGRAAFVRSRRYRFRRD